MLRLYTLLWYLALPFVTLAALRRARRERHSGIAVPALSLAQYWRERRGFLRVASSSASATSSESDAGPVTPARARPGTTFWVHAASVGEVQLAALLIKALRERPPARALALSCQTATASARAQELLPDISLSYAPYDLPAAVHRRFQLLRPAALVLIETELWPNLLAEAARQHLPVLVASARLSARSARTYRTLRALLRPSLERTVWVGAQTAADAERFSSLGVPAARLTVTGNLKFDCPLPPGMRERGAAWRARLGQRPVWVAGSTHPAEQTILLEAHRL
ncbi:MAG TPA: glycosyltransferase N-terminal domain-containing protein, partial [Steroidobacteraceae bacterium]|nr:glycosyltransferase N-terminal domain-containing protein [Steroidobacteraceae bacterium]